MDAKKPLFTGAGPRQRKLLFELEKQTIIVHSRENGIWMRGALTSWTAKDLLNKEDTPIQEKIDDLEPLVVRNEQDADRLGVKLGGGARARLNKMIELRDSMYPKPTNN